MRNAQPSISVRTKSTISDGPIPRTLSHINRVFGALRRRSVGVAREAPAELPGADSLLVDQSPEASNLARRTAEVLDRTKDWAKGK